MDSSRELWGRMVSHVATVAFQGIEAVPVDVQVQIAPGLPKFIIVGLPDKAVAESSVRVRSALHASGLALPSKRIIVNLAPADLPKEGSHLRLPIALALMAAMGAVPGDQLADFVALGELALDGTITAVAGVLPAAIAANATAARRHRPGGFGCRAAWASGEMTILAPRSLIAVGQSFSRRAGPVAAGSGRCPDGRHAARSRRHPRAGIGEARAGSPRPPAGNHLLMGRSARGRASRCWRSACRRVLPPLAAAELLEVR